MNERNAGGGEGPGHDARIHAQRLSQRATAGRIYTMPKPVIAALAGAAAGAGFALAMACDLRFAAENAVLLTSFARVGFSGDYGGTYFATQVVERMDRFSTDCDRPTVQLYGHTHGYSRGASRDHAHLWIDVASAGGNLVRWGEDPGQYDVDEVSVSQDEHGFVVLEITSKTGNQNRSIQRNQ